MCGLYPRYRDGDAAATRRTTRFELVGYTTSAEASGDTSRCVGYAGVLMG